MMLDLPDINESTLNKNNKSFEMEFYRTKNNISTLMGRSDEFTNN